QDVPQVERAEERVGAERGKEDHHQHKADKGAVGGRPGAPGTEGAGRGAAGRRGGGRGGLLHAGRLPNMRVERLSSVMPSFGTSAVSSPSWRTSRRSDRPRSSDSSEEATMIPVPSSARRRMI